MLLVATVAYLFAGDGLNPMAGIAPRVQIIPSAILSTIGATAFWLVATFVFGRLYCSTVCPVGTLQDSATWLRRRLVRRQARLAHTGKGCRNRRLRFSPYRFSVAGRYRWPIMLGYIISLIFMVVVATAIEPWNMFRSAARVSNPEANAQFLIFSGNLTYGAIFGCIELVAVWVWALFRGRAFCNEVCPIGTALGALSGNTLYQIEIDPDKCTGCMRCEDVCKSQCVKVVSRYVDNTRCVRCFDCLKVCPEDAIHFSRNRRRRSTPLLQRRVGKSV